MQVLHCGRESGLTEIVAITAGLIAAFGRTVSEKKTEAMHMSEPDTAARTMRVAVGGLEYAQINELVYLGGTDIEHAELMVKTKRHSHLAISCFGKYIIRGFRTGRVRHPR